MGAASRAMGRKPPRHAPKGLVEGGQFIGRASITHALIRKLLGVSEDHQQGSAVGRFTSRGGSVASIALHPRRPRIDDRVRDPRTGKLGRVQTLHPDGTGRVAWDDGQVESRHLGELEDPHAQRQLPDPERTFHAERGPRAAQVDTAVTTGTPGRPRTAAERMRDGLAAGKVDNDTATRLMRGESPTSIVDSRSPAGFRDAQRARLSPADQAVLDGLDANRRELYWLHRAAGEDHDKALAGVTGGGHVLNLTEKGRAALATPSSAKKATAAQRMSRAAKRPPADIAAALRSATTREQADAHLQGLTVADMTAVADELGIPRPALRGKGSRKEDIRSALVDIEVGGRAQFAAMVASQSGHDYRPRMLGGPSPAAAKMARGKAPSGPRPSGLPTDRKPTTTDFEDLAYRVSKLRIEQRRAVLADLNATELNALARQFPGDPVRSRGGVTSDRRTVLKIPAGLSVEERRRWLAGKLSGQREGDLPKVEGAVAKMARAKAPPGVSAGKPDGPQVRRVWHGFNMGPGVAQQYGRTGGDEPLYLPNRGADQGLVHLDSQLGTLWQDLVADTREPNSFVNAAARIGENVGTGTISLDEAADRLRQLSAGATDQAVARRIDATIRGITEPTPPPRIDVPDNVPPAVRRWLDDLARIPTMRKTDLPGEQSALDEALALVREISQQGLTGRRTMSSGDAENRLLGITQNVHESIDGVYHARRLTGRTFNTENPDWPAIRDWLRGRRR